MYLQTDDVISKSIDLVQGRHEASGPRYLFASNRKNCPQVSFEAVD